MVSLTDIPSTEELRQQVERQGAVLAEMQVAAELAHDSNASAGFDLDEFAFEEPDELVAATHRPPRRVPLAMRQAPVTLDQQALAAQGISLVARNIPDWDKYAERTLSSARENPVAFARALGTGDPEQVALALGSAYAATKNSDSNRQMKMQAQSAVGASGRPSALPADVAEWNAIVAAAPKRYYE